MSDFIYIFLTFENTYSLVGKYDGESSFTLIMSLHLFTVSNKRNVSPTENSVARHLASSLRAGAPSDSLRRFTSCATSFCWQLFMSDCKEREKRVND